MNGAVGDTGLYYYGYRYYSPRLGRWLSRDPIEEDGGLNLYGYMENEPVGSYDPDGRIIVGLSGWDFMGLSGKDQTLITRFAEEPR